MRGIVAIIVGLVVIVLGLGGLGVALGEMMTHADPHSSLISAGGLAVFVAGCLSMLVMAYSS